MSSSRRPVGRSLSVFLWTRRPSGSLPGTQDRASLEARSRAAATRSFEDVPPARSGIASGANSTLRQVGSALGIAILGTVLFTGLVGGTRTNLDVTLPELPAVCREAVVSLVDESAGQVLPAFRDPSGSTADRAAFAGSITPQQAACFANPSFLSAIPQAVPSVQSAFVDSARRTGLTAAGFVLLGLLFSLLLPSGAPEAATVPLRSAEPAAAPDAGA